LASTLPKLGNSNTPSEGWSPVNVKGSIRKTPRGEAAGFFKSRQSGLSAPLNRGFNFDSVESFHRRNIQTIELTFSEMVHTRLNFIVS
jgi:hypothetical protein